MGTYNLDRIFKPESVAVVGASEKEGSIGRTVMENLVEGGYAGRLMPVNPGYSKILDIDAVESVSRLDRPADLAVIATPIDTVPDIVKECAEAGVGGAVIFSAGGRETGEKGREIEGTIEKNARRAGLRIIGPNCMGVICPDRNLNASFAAHMPAGGQTAFISQSGAVCSAMLDLSLKENMGFRHFVSVGSMLDVDFGDLIDYLGDDPAVKSILLYVESLTEIRKFMSAARSVSRIKPIVVLKSGESAAGAKAAASHTGALAGEDRVYDAAFRRAGLARVRTLEEFFDCAEMLAKQHRPAGRRLAVITNAGGPGVMAADAAARAGLDLVGLGEETLSKLDDILPDHWSRGNPVDILGDAPPKRYAAVADVILENREIDGMLVIVNPQAMTDPTAVARTLGPKMAEASFPVFISMMGGRDVEKGRDILNKTGIATYETPERAVASYAVLCDYARNLELLQEIPPRLSRQAPAKEEDARSLIQEHMGENGGFLTEIESKQLLDFYGIPVTRTKRAGSAEEARQVADAMGYPVVMKILSPDITHKTEVGGVQKNLRDARAVGEAYAQMVAAVRGRAGGARIEGVSLQPMVEDAGISLLVGAKRDDRFGPVILFGMGDIFAEVIGDRNIGLPPLNRTLARRLMEETRAYELLKGYRNIAPADMGRLEALLISLSDLLVDNPEILELDMNPVLVEAGAPVAADARVRLKRSQYASPHHLVISPYPEDYECHAKTEDGLNLFIRPVKPEDAPLLIELFENLSSQSRYNRFFSPVKTLSRDMLVRLTQIDYDRHISLVALIRDGDGEKMVGAGRVIIGPDRENGEFSVMVGDPWQGKGIGGRLLEHCLDASRDYGVGVIYGYVLAENTHMLNLARDLGFAVSPGDDASTLYLRMALRGNNGG